MQDGHLAALGDLLCRRLLFVVLGLVLVLTALGFVGGGFV